MGDKELGAIRIRTRVGHAEDAWAIVAQAGMKFVGKLIAWVSFAIAKGTTTLDHKVRDDPVEDQPIVERTLDPSLSLGIAKGLGSHGQADEVGDGLGGLFLEELGDHHAL